MDSCKESKLRAQCEEERNQARLKVVLLEKEIKEHFAYSSATEKQCKDIDENQKTIKTKYEQQLSEGSELKIVAEKYLAKIEDLKKEVEAEKKLTEDWKSRFTKSEAQKGMSDQVDVLPIIRLTSNRN